MTSIVSAGNHINGDWIDRPLPRNIIIEEGAYAATAFSFLAFSSEIEPGLILRRGAGLYEMATVVVGSQGQIEVGAYSCINEAYLICNDRITIGAHCLVGWGAVISDSWSSGYVHPKLRQDSLRAAASHVLRHLPSPVPPRPVVLEDNVWVGFDAVVLAGVRLGRGCIVGCRSVITEDVPPYAVVVGNPPHILRWLEPDDPNDIRDEILKTFILRDNSRPSDRSVEELAQVTQRVPK
jgi:acetyltransferase-like isoleucine patch superfamily enzyme